MRPIIGKPRGKGIHHRTPSQWRLNTGMLDETELAAREAKRLAASRAGKKLHAERQIAMRELAKKNRAEEKAQREAEKKLKAEQQIMYPKLTPQEWKERYGTDKPKIGLIDHNTAVRMISRRMTSVALHTLAEICQSSQSDSARVSAAREILDRGWGKAHLLPEGENKPGSEITVVFGDQTIQQQVMDADTHQDDDQDEDDEADEADDEDGAEEA